MKKSTEPKKSLSPKMRKHLKRMQEAARLAAAKRRKAKAKLTPAPKPAKKAKKAKKRREKVVPPMTPIDVPEPAKKGRRQRSIDPRQTELQFGPAVAELTLPAADDGSEPASSPAVDVSETPLLSHLEKIGWTQPGEELL